MERKSILFSINDVTIEYSIVGEGPCVLVMHGGHSSCREAFGYSTLVESGFTVITPSRAGYGKTSKKIGKSLSTACWYYLQLLNRLEIDKVHVVAISAGGPSGILFASTYPERVKSLTLQSAVTKQWKTTGDLDYKISQFAFRPPIEKAIWKTISLISNYFPDYLFKQFASSFSTCSYGDISSKINNEDMVSFASMISRQRSGFGFLIDLKSHHEMTSANLQHVLCPALIMHSENDGAVSVEHAYYAHELIPDTELCILDTWGHLIWIGEGAKRYNQRFLQFLKNK